jgi:transcriptional regulator with XRE-family HTH domain
MGHGPAPLGPGFWSSPAVAQALACCDFGVLLEEVRKAHGWTQAELAQVVGYSQSWVSRVVRGRQPLTLEQAREVAGRVGIPLHLLRLAGAVKEDAAKRRDFGKAVTLALVPWPASPHTDEQATGAALTAVTAAQRRLDAQLPGRELAYAVVAHVEMAHRMLGHASRPGGGAGTVAAALSEAAGFAGWLHADMCDRGSARGYYRLAVRAAQRAGHDLLAGYMLGSLAAFEIDNGDPVTGLTLASRASQQMGSITHPAPRAWLAAIRALGHATAGDQRAADSALGHAEQAIDGSDAAAAPPWPWLYPFDAAKLAGYRALVCVRLNRPGQALAAFAESLAAAQPAPKQRAVLTLEVATAACQDGAASKDTARIDEAFGLAAGALAAGQRYGSERVTERSRQFRRSYTGPTTTGVRDFDRQLAATLS